MSSKYASRAPAATRKRVIATANVSSVAMGPSKDVYTVVISGSDHTKQGSRPSGAATAISHAVNR